MKNTVKLLLAVALMVVLQLSTASAGLVIGPDAAYLERANNHPYVGWVETASATFGNFRASGVLIDPHWVLTAGHVVQDNALPTSIYDSFTFGLGSNSISNRGEASTTSEVFVNPRYGGSAFRGYDLALLYFANPFSTVTPVSRYLVDIAVGQDSDLVGFGRYQMVNDPNSTFTGDRRAGNNVVDSVSVTSRPEYFSTSLYNTFFPEFYRDLQMGGRPGDSGGALIINGQLAGIVSTGGSNAFGSPTFYSRLDNAWIDATIASKGTAVPEPSSFLLLSTLAGGLLLRRRWSLRTDSLKHSTSTL